MALQFIVNHPTLPTVIPNRFSGEEPAFRFWPTTKDERPTTAYCTISLIVPAPTV
jgi:hypothetical protein